jgi:hypothetical protein
MPAGPPVAELPLNVEPATVSVAEFSIPPPIPSSMEPA